MLVDSSVVDSLPRMDIRNEILQILEKGILKNSGSWTCDKENWFEMRKLVHKFYFNVGTSCSEGWETLTTGGLKGEGSNESSCGIITLMRSVEWPEVTVTHTMTINYRTTKGEMKIYVGNLVDFHDQVVKLITTSALSNKFGL